MTAKISIIVPVYNSEQYLSRCLNSLINQTFDDIEVICINDGSADNSLQILNEYAKKDKRIKVFSQENAGPAKARNVGLENASGEYIMFCDTDDWYENNMCEKMFHAIATNDVDCVMCHTNFTWEDQLDYRKISDTYYNPVMEGIIKDDLYKINVLLWNKIFKKSLIEQYHITFPTGFKHDDDCFWFKYSFFNRGMLIIQDKLYNYVIRKNSIMDDYFLGKQASYLDRLAVFKNVLSFFLDHHLEHSHSEQLLSIYLDSIYATIPFVDLNTIWNDLTDINQCLATHNIYLTENTKRQIFKDSLFRNKFKYYRNELFSKLTWGKLHLKFKNKSNKVKFKIKMVEDLFKQ